MSGQVRLPTSMRTPDRARQGALVLLAAVAATAAVGIAALARTGAALCGHRVLVHHHDPAMVMPGIAAAAPAAGGMCPILLYGAAVAAVLCGLAVTVMVSSRGGAPAMAVVAARWIAAVPSGPLAAAIALAGAAPLFAILATEGGLAGLPALGALAALLAGALAAALALMTAARVVLAFARRVAVAIAAAFRLLVPGDGARWAFFGDPLLAPASLRLARRRPSRAPPALR